MKTHLNAKIFFEFMYKNCFTFHLENSLKEMPGIHYCLSEPWNFAVENGIDSLSPMIIHKETLKTIKTCPKRRKINVSCMVSFHI